MPLLLTFPGAPEPALSEVEGFAPSSPALTWGSAEVTRTAKIEHCAAIHYHTAP